MFLTEETAIFLPTAKVPAFERGSKLLFADICIYITMRFTSKAVMLATYRKMVCTPIERNWQVRPHPGVNCTTRPQNYWVIGFISNFLNILLVLIPMPILVSLKIPIQQRLALMALFGSGIFIVIEGILRQYYGLNGSQDIKTGVAWANRESFVTMLVVMAPGIWPLLRRSHKFACTYNSSNSATNNASQSSGRWGASANQLHEPDSAKTSYEMFYQNTSGETQEIVVYSNDSEERILNAQDGNSMSHTGSVKVVPASHV
ncbi:Fc.00g104630.m01.CDS01 [Cosmosporella sp. VM-42]